MKNYFCVTSKFFSDGYITAKIDVFKFERKPENKVVKKPSVHIYTEWFDTMADARRAEEKFNNFPRSRSRNQVAKPTS